MMAQTTGYRVSRDIPSTSSNAVLTTRIPVLSFATNPVEQQGSLFIDKTTDTMYLSTGEEWIPILSGLSFGGTAQSVGVTNLPGTLPTVSRSDHVHQGVHSVASNLSVERFGDIVLKSGAGVTIVDNGDGSYTFNASGSSALINPFGNGADGNFTVPVGTTTLTRDMYYGALAVPAGSTLNTNGFIVYSLGGVTMSGGTITNDGGAGGNATPLVGGTAGQGAPNNTAGGGTNGGAGVNANVVGKPGGTIVNAIGGQGGAGGTGGSAGGAGGTLFPPAASIGSTVYITDNTNPFSRGTFSIGVPGEGGSGGGSGGGGAGVGATGGGGGGAGTVDIVAMTMAGTGTISASGGNAGSPAGTGFLGGSGGGGGGLIRITSITNMSSVPTIVLVVNGGIGSSGTGGGTNGANGLPGRVVTILA